MLCRNVGDVGEMVRSKIDNGDAGSSGDASLKSGLKVRQGGGGQRKGLSGDVGVVGEYGNCGEHGDTGESDDAGGSWGRRFLGILVPVLWCWGALNCSDCGLQVGDVFVFNSGETCDDRDLSTSGEVVNKACSEPKGSDEGISGSDSDIEGIEEVTRSMG